MKQHRVTFRPANDEGENRTDDNCTNWNHPSEQFNRSRSSSCDKSGSDVHVIGRYGHSGFCKQQEFTERSSNRSTSHHNAVDLSRRVGEFGETTTDHWWRQHQPICFYVLLGMVHGTIDIWPPLRSAKRKHRRRGAKHHRYEADLLKIGGHKPCHSQRPLAYIFLECLYLCRLPVSFCSWLRHFGGIQCCFIITIITEKQFRAQCPKLNYLRVGICEVAPTFVDTIS